VKCAIEDRHSQSVIKKEKENSLQIVQWKPLALTRTAIPVPGEN
jgi:hypothetical protein